MQIGVIYLKKDQTLLQALVNDQFNLGSCAKFSAFATSIGCEDFEEVSFFCTFFLYFIPFVSYTFSLMFLMMFFKMSRSNGTYQPQ